MAAKLIVCIATDFNGTILSGAKLNVYEAGTTTRRAIYTTSALSAQDTNPAIATSDGAIAVWIDDTAGDYKVSLTNSAESITYYQQDNIPAAESNLLIYPLGGQDQSLATTDTPQFAGMVLTGDLDMSGNDIILDADNDTKIVVNGDDSVSILIGGTEVLKLDGAAADKLILDGVSFSPTGAAIGQALGFPNSASTLEPYTPLGAGDLLSTANLSELTDPAAAKTNLRATFDTVADFKATGTGVLVDGESFRITSHTTDGDGGGGIFYWDASSTATDDNGFTIALTAGGNGRAIRSPVADVRPRMFGAAMDGTTADDTAFASALDVAAAQNIPLVVDGPCLLSTQHEIESDTTLRVEAGAYILWNDPAATNLFKIVGDRVTIQGPGEIRGPFWESEAIGETANTSVETSAGAATGVADTHYFMDTRNGDQTLNLPALPSDGDEIIVYRFRSENGATVDGNGNDIRRFGAGSNVSSVVLEAQECCTYRYSTSDSRWNEVAVIRVVFIQSAFEGVNDGTDTNLDIVFDGVSFKGWGYAPIYMEDVQIDVRNCKFWKSGYGHVIVLSPYGRGEVVNNYFGNVAPGLAGNAPFLNAYHVTFTADSPPLYRIPENIRIENNFCEDNFRWTSLDYHGANNCSISNNTIVRCFNPIYLGFSDDASTETEVSSTANGAVASGNVITLADATGFQVGMTMDDDTYFLRDTRIYSVAGNDITLDKNVKASIPDTTAITAYFGANVENSKCIGNIADADSLRLVDAGILLASYGTSGGANNICTDNIVIGYGTRDYTDGGFSRQNAAGRGQNAAINVDVCRNTVVDRNTIPSFNGIAIEVSLDVTGSFVSKNYIGTPTEINSKAIGVEINNQERGSVCIQDNIVNEGQGTITAFETNNSVASTGEFGLRFHEQNIINASTILGTNLTTVQADRDWNEASRYGKDEKIGFTSDNDITIGRGPIEGGDGKNILIGRDAGGSSWTTGYENVIVGDLAGDSFTTGFRNVCVGPQAGRDLTEGDSNVAVGYLSGTNLTTGGSNVAIGRSALQTVTTGDNNIAIGGLALSAQTGSNGVALGYLAGRYTTGSNNTAIGYLALEGDATNPSTGGGNTCVGSSAGRNIETGIDNVCIGKNAGDVITTGSNNIMIGDAVDPSGATASNEINIGGAIITTVGTQVIGDQQSAIADLSVTFTANAPAAADGSITIADGSSPTNAELLEYCAENDAKIDAILTALRNHGLIAT